jgi:K+-transporting ATPase KdpF subunit
LFVFVPDWRTPSDRHLHHRCDDVAHARWIVGGRVLSQGAEMSTIYWIAGAVAFALSIYLTIALLKPEWFE